MTRRTSFLCTATMTVLLLSLLGSCARDQGQKEAQQHEESVSGGSAGGVAEHSMASGDSNDKPLTQQDEWTASSMSTQPTESTTVDEQSNDEWMTRCVGENRQEVQNDTANGKIGFLRRASSSSYPNVYVMNSDGSGQSNLTSTNGIPETAPSWSPSGKQIAFTSGQVYENQDIYVMNTEGTGRTRLAENASSPSFAPRAGEK